MSLSEKEQVLLEKIQSAPDEGIPLAELSPQELGTIGKLTQFVETYKNYVTKKKMVREKRVKPESEIRMEP